VTPRAEEINRPTKGTASAVPQTVARLTALAAEVRLSRSKGQSNVSPRFEFATYGWKTVPQKLRACVAIGIYKIQSRRDG
jgi:hypothetical protein